MESLVCPLCQAEMVLTERKGFSGYFNFFVCTNCHAELKQPLVRAPEKKTGDAQEHCPDCAFSDVNCFSCGDPICEKHVRTTEKYARFVSPELGARLNELYGSQIYCPLCIQTVFNRITLDVSGSKKGGRQKSPFRFTIILGLLALMLIIMIGVKRCPASKQLDQLNETQNEQSEPIEP